ncbi:hypothetical protein ES708_09265 [subsurface metagenome]
MWALSKLVSETKILMRILQNSIPVLSLVPMFVSLSRMTVRVWMKKQEAGYLNPFSQQSFRAVGWGWPLCMELSRIMMVGSLWTLSWAKALWSESTFLPWRLW